MRFKVLMMVFVFALINWGTWAEPSEISISEIQGMVKNINLPEDQLSSLALDMRMNLPLPMKINIQLRFSNPDQYALYVFDGSDQTPILVVAGQKALINDPMAETISVIASAGVAFNLAPQGDQYTANFAFNMPVEGKINNRVNLDFTTLFSRVSVDVKTSREPDGLIFLNGKTEQKSSCTAHFLASGAFPLNSLALYMPEQSEAVLEFPLIRVNEKVAEDVFVFPLEKLASSGVKFASVNAEGVIDTMMVVASVMRALFSRAAIKNAPLRAEIEKSLMMSPDWEKLAKNDSERAELLKRVFVPLKD